MNARSPFVLMGLLLLGLLPGSALASDAVWRGSFIAKSEEAGFFSPCRSGKRYRTNDSSGEGWSLYRQLAQRAGRPIFLEFVGSRDSEDSVRIERVLRAAASGPGCAEDSSFAVRAYGAMPTWRLEHGARGLVFQRAASKALTWPAPRAERDAAGVALSAQGDAGDIHATIRAGRCFDELAGAVFSWRAEIVFEGRTYHGCAYEGEERHGKEKAPR